MRRREDDPVRAARDELGDEATLIVGTGSNDTLHTVELTKVAAEAGADAAIVVTPYYNKPNRGRADRPLRAPSPRSGCRSSSTTSPREPRSTSRPDLLAELGRLPNIVAVKQANDDELGPIEGLDVLAGNDGVFCRTLEFGGAGGILVSSHLVGPQMREMWDAAQEGDLDRVREIDAELQPIYEATTVTANPIPVKAALQMLGVIESDALRLPMVPPTEEQRAAIRPALERGGDPGSGGLSGTLRVLPLGGLGEIGKNMTVVEYDGRIVVVDTGLMFPTAEMLGIDLVLPDFSYLRERAGDIEAIVLTHGHEDHVGALPYVLRELGDPPVIYGGLLTVGLVRSKLDEHKLGDAPLEELEAGEKVQLGPFELELIHLSHSIPDMRGVLLKHRAGLGAADRRLQVRPDPGRRAPGRRLAARRAGARGPAAALRRLDQRRPSRRRPFGVERRPGAAGHLLAAAEGRIIVTCFASNVHRVQQVIDAAVQLDRRVALVGRSMRKNFNIASNLGIAKAPSGLFIQPKEIEDFPDEKVIAISTGSQGEPLSALRRMAHNDHRDVELHSGDTVVFSATPIPGNERAVNETDRPHLPDRRLGGDRRRCPDPRLRPRLAGGAEADAQPDQAALRAARPRRPQAAAAARRPGAARWGSMPRVHLHRARTACRWRSTDPARGSARRSAPG